MSPKPARAAIRAVSVEEAVAAILRAVPEAVGNARAVEEVALAEATGRVLATAITAAEDLWPFPRAAMDGIAVRAADVATASADRPVRLSLAGAIYAGETEETPLAPGTCVRIATGAPVPSGADAVVPREWLQIDGENVFVRQAALPRMHIFPPGEDIRAGERVLEPGVVLHGGHIALLAAMGYDRMPVFRRPVVAILTCGDELVEAGQALRPGAVRESNSYALAADVQALGAVPVRLGNARDVDQDLDARIRHGLDADVLITSGGLSVGERDLVRPAMRRAGVAFEFEGVAMKPGAPAAFGRAGDRLVFALPGTPSACRVAFHVLAAPALRALAGYVDTDPLVSARLSVPLKMKPGRRRYLWGRAALGADGLVVAPHLVQSTAALRAASDANALIVIDPATGDLPAGARVPVQLLPHAMLPVAPGRRQAVLGVVGPRESGKTRLIERLVPALGRRGLAVAVVKHHAHQGLIDQEGTDTARAAAAGAVRTILAGPGGITIRVPAGQDPAPEEVLVHAGDAAIVLVEGYSQLGIPKILVQRAGVTSDRIPPAGPIIAVVGDTDLSAGPGMAAVGDADSLAGPPRFSREQVDTLAEFIISHLLRD